MESEFAVKTTLSMDTPSRSGLSMQLSRHSVGTCPEMNSHATLSGNTRPQSSQLAEPQWTVPGLKNWINVRELQVPGPSYNWRGFQAWDTFPDSTNDSSIDEVETSLEYQEHFSQFQNKTAALHCNIYLPVCLWIMSHHNRAAKKNTNYGNEVLQDTTHLIQRPYYQRRSPCQDPAGNRTTRRPPDHRKETQTEVV